MCFSYGELVKNANSTIPPSMWQKSSNNTIKYRALRSRQVLAGGISIRALGNEVGTTHLADPFTKVLLIDVLLGMVALHLLGNAVEYIYHQSCGLATLGVQLYQVLCFSM